MISASSGASPQQPVELADAAGQLVQPGPGGLLRPGPPRPPPRGSRARSASASAEPARAVSQLAGRRLRGRASLGQLGGPFRGLPGRPGGQRRPGRGQAGVVGRRRTQPDQPVAGGVQGRGAACAASAWTAPSASWARLGPAPPARPSAASGRRRPRPRRARQRVRRRRQRASASAAVPRPRRRPARPAASCPAQAGHGGQVRPGQRAGQRGGERLQVPAPAGRPALPARRRPSPPPTRPPRRACGPRRPPPRPASRRACAVVDGRRVQRGRPRRDRLLADRAGLPGDQVRAQVGGEVRPAGLVERRAGARRRAASAASSAVSAACRSWPAWASLPPRRGRRPGRGRAARRGRARPAPAGRGPTAESTAARASRSACSAAVEALAGRPARPPRRPARARRAGSRRPGR